MSSKDQIRFNIALKKKTTNFQNIIGTAILRGILNILFMYFTYNEAISFHITFTHFLMLQMTGVLVNQLNVFSIV